MTLIGLFSALLERLQCLFEGAFDFTCVVNVHENFDVDAGVAVDEVKRRHDDYRIQLCELRASRFTVANFETNRVRRQKLVLKIQGVSKLINSSKKTPCTKMPEKSHVIIMDT